MRWKQQDANERGDQEWVPTGLNALDIAIFHNGTEFEIVMSGDQLATAKTLAEAKQIAENLGSLDKTSAS